jgi:hypothetical protein
MHVLQPVFSSVKVNVASLHAASILVLVVAFEGLFERHGSWVEGLCRSSAE